MESSLHDLMAWLHDHSLWLAVAIFLTAFLETLVMVGLILPGVVMLFALATLAGGGALGIWPAMICAFIGAVLGDTISYGLGRRFHEQIKSWWPFRQHPGWIASGERFFLKYGGLSVATGRFVGPIRPIIPLVAGMMDMPVQRFWFANILSAIVWAPAYLVPGFLIGAAVTQADTLDQLYEVVLPALGLAITLGFLAAAAGEFIARKSCCSPKVSAASTLLGMLTLLLGLQIVAGDFLHIQQLISDRLSLIRQADFIAFLQGVNAIFIWPVIAGICLVILGIAFWLQGIRCVLIMGLGITLAHVIAWYFVENNYESVMALALFSFTGCRTILLLMSGKPWGIRGAGYALVLCIVVLSGLSLIWNNVLVLHQILQAILLGGLMAGFQLPVASSGKSVS